jgi:hypothetical protein
MSDRSDIVTAITDLIKQIDGTDPNASNLYGNVSSRLKFWDEVSDYPYVCLTAGTETREYLPGGFKWANLSIGIKIYVHGEEPEKDLENIISDIERVLDNNFDVLHYDKFNPSKVTQDIRISSIYTDEGVLAPHGVGEITLEVLYEKIN